MCFYRWFVQHTHLCVAHSELHKVFNSFNNSFNNQSGACGMVWCGVVGWGGGGKRILVSGARVVDEVSEGVR